VPQLPRSRQQFTVFKAQDFQLAEASIAMLARSSLSDPCRQCLRTA